MITTYVIGVRFSPDAFFVTIIFDDYLIPGLKEQFYVGK
jgi:hypothetical protein